MPVTRPLLVATLICALSLSHSNATAQAQASKSSLSLNALADRYYEEKVRLDPVYTGTLSGDNRFDDQLPITIAPAMRKKCFVLLHQVQRQLGAIGRHRLNETDAITYDVLSQGKRLAAASCRGSSGALRLDRESHDSRACRVA